MIVVTAFCDLQSEIGASRRKLNRRAICKSQDEWLSDEWNDYVRNKSSAVEKFLFKFAINVNDDLCTIFRKGDNLNVCEAIFLSVFKVKWIFRSFSHFISRVRNILRFRRFRDFHTLSRFFTVFNHFKVLCIFSKCIR